MFLQFLFSTDNWCHEKLITSLCLGRLGYIWSCVYTLFRRGHSRTQGMLLYLTQKFLGFRNVKHIFYLVEVVGKGFLLTTNCHWIWISLMGLLSKGTPDFVKNQETAYLVKQARLWYNCAIILGSRISQSADVKFFIYSFNLISFFFAFCFTYYGTLTMKLRYSPL